MANHRFIKFNFNPWNQTQAADCAIRAISAATGLDYREVCKKLGVSYKRGKGLIRDTGIDLDQIEEVFGDYCDVVEDFYQNFNFVPDEMAGSKEDLELQAFELQNGMNSASGLTLNDFVDMFKDQGTFLVSLVENPEASNVNSRKGGHIVCVRCGKNAVKQGFIDTWDSGEMLVDTYMRIVKTEPKDSPLHWRYDRAQHKFIV